MKSLPITKWAADDRPREKLLSRGVESLSDAELIAILLGTGTREHSAVELGRRLLAASDNSLLLLSRKSMPELMKLKGIGKAKAIGLIAAMELGRRRDRSADPENCQVTSSKDIFLDLGPVLSKLVHEEFWVIYLNRANRIIDRYKCSQGGVSGTVIDIRLVLRRALEVLSSSWIIVHNHPSGNRFPSEHDRRITEKLSQAAGQMDMKLLDHLIIAGMDYYSFADEGLL